MFEVLALLEWRQLGLALGDPLFEGLLVEHPDILSADRGFCRTLDALHPIVVAGCTAGIAPPKIPVAW
ncbi:hypothetical protein Ssi02_00330 [Sinosporangium siamense]|uniref:Uncharacterized protein n=1 Tax=Sinosporangium siamense TaxID=1367973 RepID=A0A919RA76_9ACTN|nr:hypothetical protein Ssi02_00330 [Sinosporangium siamense]